MRRFVEQVFIPQMYEDGIWREKSGQSAEYLFRSFILPGIGALQCRDLKADHLRGVLRKMADEGQSRPYVNKVRFAMGDMIKKMIGEQYLVFNIATGLKTPKTARPSDRSRLKRVTLGQYQQVWTVLDERERLAFDLVTFCGLRESEVYGLKNGDLYEHGAIRVERSWYKGKIEPPKTGKPRNVGIGAEIFDRLTVWIATLADRSGEGWVFPSEGIVTPLWPGNVLVRCVYPRLDERGIDRINFRILRRSHSTLHQSRHTEAKIIADQQGHGLGVHLGEYVDSSMTEKREAVSALWADFKALTPVAAIPN